jgi:RNA polymerase sigma-70 factor (ECF subfamily)
MTQPAANPLVRALANGQPEAYGVLYDRLGPALLRAAHVMLSQSGEAEDAVQDVFVELVRHRNELAHVRDLDAYVFAMLRHNVGRRISRQRNERKHLSKMTVTQTTSSSLSADDDLAGALAGLPPRQREVIALKFDGSLTFSQVAEILGVSPNTVASRYRYAIQKLRRLLSTKDGT